MKIAYRIVTPILAAGAVVMAFLLDMFSFSIQISDKLQPIGASFSLIESIQKLTSAKAPDTEGAKSITEIIQPMLPATITFFVFFILAMLIMISIIFVSALSTGRKPVFILCAAGLVCMFAGIIASNSAFATLLDSEKINLGEVLGAFLEGTTGTLATLAGTLASYLSNIRLTATLSVAFYAMFGIYIIIIVWAIIAGFVIKNPIVRTKKEYRRKKPLRKII